ncbi:MAG: DUF305 domain-containing protein [Clostridia bacterium]|nr:DUF305 domain-containing protein [Clostridia bacterium]
MQNRQAMKAKKYLCRYDEIVNEMAKKMLAKNVTNSITINFIEDMIPHHQVAIEMSENLLQFTTYQPLQEIAQNIIKMQTTGIEQMEEIEKNTYGFSNMPLDVNHYMKKYLEITKNMIERMKNTPRLININLNFINEMIPHHEGAIAMCENLLLYRINPKLKLVAESIIKEQSKGVQELKEMQKKFRW